MQKPTRPIDVAALGITSDFLLERSHEVIRDPQMGACREWDGLTNPAGYGLIASYRFGNLFAHRVSYALENSDPGQLIICHRCDNPPCIEPTHLFAGTYKDNSLDAKSKGRTAHGAGVANAAIVDSDVSDIRRIHASGMASQDDLAETYGMSKGSVSRIIRNEMWQHVPPFIGPAFPTSKRRPGFRQSPRRALDENQVEWARKQVAAGLSLNKTAAALGVARETVKLAISTTSKARTENLHGRSRLAPSGR
jgi:hypothetical protein